MTYIHKYMYDYYDAEPRMTVAQITKKWAVDSDKMYDSSMPYMMDVNDLWKYRDYDWTKETGRSGRAYPFYHAEEQPHLPGPERWDKMKEHMAKFGWDEREPAMLTVGKDGKAKLGEGNHRLAIWKSLGKREVPVRIFFYTTIGTTHDGMSYPPRIAETFKQFIKEQEQQTYIGYKIVGFKDGKYFSLYDKSTINPTIGSIQRYNNQGLFLGNSSKFCTDYYQAADETDDYKDALMTYEYALDDLIKGEPIPSKCDGEVQVRKAKLIKIDILPPALT